MTGLFVVIVNNFAGGAGQAFADCLNALVNGQLVTWAQFVSYVTACS